MSKIVLITGANSGVGYATAKVIAGASEQYHIIMTGRSLQKVEAAKSKIEATGVKGSLSALQLDVTDDETIKKAVAAVESQFGHLDALINNAGVSVAGTDLRSRLTQTYLVNTIGPAVVAEAFLPLLYKAEKGYSIYITSGMGSLAVASDPTSPWFMPSKNDEAYRSSKAALNMIMVKEWQRTRNTNVKTFALCPGFVRSNLRGESEEARSGGGLAEDPEVSAKLILSLLEGKRDADTGKAISKDTFHPW